MTVTIDASDPILERALRWSYLGMRTLQDGTILVGHTPRRGTDAYLHKVYSPLNQADVFYIERSLSKELPIDLVKFYYQHNGCSLFSGHISVYGRRRSYKRSDIDLMSASPFDIVNMSMTQRNLYNEYDIRIGKYLDDTPVFIKPDGSIRRVDSADNGRTLNSWPSIMTWILSEFDRISVYFDRDGYRSVDLPTTLPVPD